MKKLRPKVKCQNQESCSHSLPTAPCCLSPVSQAAIEQEGGFQRQVEEDERIGLMVQGRGLEAKTAQEGLEMFWGTLRSEGRYSKL